MAALDGGEPTSAEGCPPQRHFNQFVLKRLLGTLSELLRPIPPVAFLLIRSLRNSMNGTTVSVNGPKELAYKPKAGGMPQHLLATRRGCQWQVHADSVRLLMALATVPL